MPFKDADERREYKRQYLASKREVMREYLRFRYLAGFDRRPEQKADSHRRHKYGIEPVEYQRIFREQVGRCAICLRSGRSLDVDHDHNTGKIRGLLCRPCNMIVNTNATTHTLMAAINYLQRTSDAGEVAQVSDSKL